MTPDQVRREVIADLGRFTHDPPGFVLWAFPRGAPGTSLENEDGPDVWQRDQLRAIADVLQADLFKVFQDATASGHGIGKSSQVSWLTYVDLRRIGCERQDDTYLRGRCRWQGVAAGCCR